MEIVAMLLLVTPLLTLPVIYLSTAFMLYLHNDGLARIRNGLRIQNLVFLFTWMQTQNEMLGLAVAATSGDTDIHTNIPTPSSFRWNVHDQDLNRNPGEARKLCDTTSTNTNNKKDRCDNKPVILVNECDGGALPT